MSLSKVIPIRVTEEQDVAIKRLAKALGTTPSKLGRILITKALGGQPPADPVADLAKANELVASGKCSDEAEALKLVKALRGEWD